MRARTPAVVLVSFLGACGGGPKPPPTAPAVVARPTLPPGMPAAFAPVGLVLGDWRTSGEGSQHWVAAGGTLYGVGFTGAAWSVSLIDDGDGKAGKADGRLRYIELGDGRLAFELEAQPSEVGRVRFGSEAMGVVLGLELKQLVVTWNNVIGRDRRDDHATELVGRDGHEAGPARMIFEPAADAPAPELEAADRQFAADTAADGVAGWVKWFAPDGALWRDERIEGRDAIGAKLEGTLATGVLAWTPIASRRHGDDLGFTVGTATWTATGATEPAWRGSYVTIWHKQPDGSWRVAFDAGRGDQPSE